MKSISLITVLMTALTISLLTVKAEAKPLTYSDSLNQSLQLAHTNKNMALVAYEFANIKAQRFCVASNAYSNPTEWDACIKGVQPLAYAEKMSRLAEHTRD